MNSINEPIDNNKIFHLSFNQDNSCFSVGKENGFQIFETIPFQNKYERKMDGDIGQIEMLYRTNILALIGGGENPKFNINKVIIWDDYHAKILCEIKLSSPLRNIKLKKDKIFIICRKIIYVFNMKTFNNIEIIQTKENQKGLIAINNNPLNTIIAFPIKEKDNKGWVTIKNYEKNTLLKILIQEDNFSYISMNNEGNLLASSNEKGTLIKIHNTINGDFLMEFKRGKEKAEIYYICFDNKSKYMAVCSSRKTIHIWSMGSSMKKMKEKESNSLKSSENSEMEENNVNEENNKIDENLPQNKKSIWSGLPKFIGNHFQQEYSFAKIRIESEKSICAFCKDDIIVVISYDGNYYQAKLDTKNGGICKILCQQSIFKKNDN